MSTLNVNTITPNSGTTVTIGGSGDTVTLGSGASSSGFGVAVAGIAGISTFTSSGTWTKATREAALGVTIKRVIVEVQGGGGAGGDGSGYPQGAGGGYARKLIDVTGISSATITVGSGGAGGSTGAGPSGGSSSWSDGTNTVTGNGGQGGEAAMGTYRNGGTGSGGDINIQGGDSGPYLGGGSFLGHGGVRRTVAASTYNSQNARGYGGGGGGSGGGSEGGAGGDGIVIVTEIAG